MSIKTPTKGKAKTPKPAAASTRSDTTEKGKKAKTRKKHKTKIDIEDVRRALIAAKGNYSIAARSLGYHADGKRVSPVYIQKFVTREPYLQEAVLETKNRILDLCEFKLMTRIEEGFFPAITYYLDRQGKDRGYVKREERTGKDGAPIFNHAELADGLRDVLQRKFDSIARAASA